MFRLLRKNFRRPWSALLAVILLTGTVSRAEAQFVFPGPTFGGSGPQGFGSSVALNGEWAFVRQPVNNGFDAEVRVFSKASGDWVFSHVISPPPSAFNDPYAQGIASDGEWLVVLGTRNLANCFSQGFDDAVMYVYELVGGTWQLESETDFDDFVSYQTNTGANAVGATELHVDVDGDGDVIVVGGYVDIGSCNEQNRVEIFTRSGSTWLRQSINGFPDGYGKAVDAGGDLIAIGAPDANGGDGLVQIRLRNPAGSNWQNLGPINPPNGHPGNFYDFGRDVAIEGDRLFVATGYSQPTAIGAVVEYTIDPVTGAVGAPTVHFPPQGGEFGWTLDLAGSVLVVTHRFLPTPDRFYVYSAATTPATMLADIQMPLGASQGETLAVEETGDVVLGVQNANIWGEAYFYEVYVPELDCDGDGMPELDCDGNGGGDRCQPGAVEVLSSAPVTVSANATDLCGASSVDTDGVLLYTPGQSVTLTAPVRAGYQEIDTWVGVGGGCCQIVVTGAQDPVTAEVLYQRMYDVILDGFTTIDPGTMQRMTSHQDLVTRYTVDLIAGVTRQALFEQALAEDELDDGMIDPRGLKEYAQLQGLIAAAALVEIDALPYVDLDMIPGPDFPLAEVQEDILELIHGTGMPPSGGALLEAEKILPYMNTAQCQIDFDRLEGNGIGADSSVASFLTGVRTWAELLMRELSIRASRALTETDVEREMPDSEYQAAVAVRNRLAEVVELVRAIYGAVLTAEEVSDYDLNGLAQYPDRAQLVLDELDSRVVPSLWIAQLGLAPQEVQVWDAFVPNPIISVQTLWTEAVDAANGAELDWLQANTAAREYDQDQTRLNDERLNLRARYLDRLRDLTGIDPNQAAFEDMSGVPLANEALIASYLAALFGDIDRPPLGNFPGPEDVDVAATGNSAIAEHILYIAQAKQGIGLATAQLDQANGFLAIERQRSDEVIRVLGELGTRREEIERELAWYASATQSGGLDLFYIQNLGDYMDQVAERRLTVAGFHGGEPVHVPSSFHLRFSNPFIPELSDLRGELAATQNAQETSIATADQVAALEQLRLQRAVAEEEFRARQLEHSAAQIAFRRVLLEVQILIDQYRTARQNLDNAYFANPTYRVLKDVFIEQAEFSQQQAVIKAYRACRRVEYAWAAQFSNDGLGPAFADFENAESVFRAQTPFDVQNYLAAVDAWDFALRSVTANEDIDAVVLSLRKDILALPDFLGGQPVPLEQLLGNIDQFRLSLEQNLITEFLTPTITGSDTHPSLLMTFPLTTVRPIATAGNPSPTPSFIASKFGAGEFNRKIERIAINLVGDPGMLLGTASVEVALVQRGAAAFEAPPSTGVSAVLFDADPWENLNTPFAFPNAIEVDSLLNWPDLLNNPPTSNFFFETGFDGRAISASQWTIFINTNLGATASMDITKLRDIEIRIEYRSKAPSFGGFDIFAP